MRPSFSERFCAKLARLLLQIGNPRVLCVASLDERRAELSSDRLGNVRVLG
jgi:hypothetical protein